MVFTKNSVMVKTWVSLVVSGAFGREQVPKLFNLRTVVYGVLDVLVGE